MTKVVIFCGILIVHWAGQFLAWSYANAVFPHPLAWEILSAPLMLVADALPRGAFWVMATLNSALWAAVGTYLIRLLARPADAE
jgi:hypothetical protein